MHEGAVNQYKNYTFLKLFDRQPETWRAGDYITSYTIDSIGEAPFYFIDARKVALPEGYDYAMMPFLPDSSSSVRDNYLMFTYWTSTAYPASHNLSGSSYVWYWNDSNGKNAALPYIANDYASGAGSSYRYIFENTTFSNSSNPLVSRNTNSFVRCVAAKKDLYSISTMQEITDEIIRNTDVEASKMLTDTRDGKKYWVTKELDGNIWMTQNLDFDISTEGTQLSPLTSDVLSDKTLTAVSPYGTDSLGVYYIDEGDYYYSDTYSTEGTDFAESDNSQSVQTHFHVGNSYSWNAATAGSGALTTAGNDAAESICPKGWHLPTNETNYLTNFNNNSSFQTLYTTLFAKGMDRAENVRYEGYYYSVTNPISYPPLYFHMTGSYSPGGSKSYNTEASYWTSKLANISGGTSYNPYEFVLNYSYLYDSNIYSMKDRTMYGAFGLKVRCVARNVEDYTMNYDANGGSNAPLGESGITSTREHSITVTSEVPTRYGFKFIGWATAPDKLEAEYQAGDTFTFSSNSATLYAVWETTLQAFKCSWLDAVGSTVKAIDVRDNRKYTVKKLADEKCWTIENLRLDLSDLEEDITPENTNNPTEEFMNAANATPRPSSSNEWCTSSTEECYNQIQYNSDNIGDFNSIPTTQGGDGNPFDSYGAYYNWYTAVAGNEVFDISRIGTNYNNGFISGDLCPYGWHIPSTQDYKTLNSLYTGTSRYDVIMNAGYFVATSFSARAYSSFYWTIGGDTQFVYATWNENSSWPWYEGSTIKCVANMEDQYHISYSANGGGSNIPQDSYTTKSNSGRAVFTLSYKTPTRAGYTFEGWSTDPNATTAKYQPGQTITVFTPVTKLYAVWVTDFQNFDCSRLANIGDRAVVKDSRDGKNYTIAKLADGQCWMTSDLKLTFSSSLIEDISPENTNNPTQAFMDAANARPGAASTKWCSDSSSADCLNQMLHYGYSYWDSDARSTLYDYYYNWYAATAGNGTYEKNSGYADGDICPAGWHLPTGSGFGEFGALSKALGGRYDSSTGEAWSMWDSTSPTGATMSEAFRSSPSNFNYTGYRYGSYTYSRGTNGYYWSSAANGNSYAYNVDMSSTYLAPGTTSVYKYYGYGVRCIADYQKDYTIVFNVNGGTGAPANQVVTSGKGRATVTIPDTIPTREGFTFRGWGTERYMSAPEYQPGNEIILMAPSPTLTLYAVWEATTSLQNFSCSSLLPNVGDVAVARDVRDNQYYGVIKLADGNCWLAEDLRLDLNYLQESISSENTNNPSSTFITQVNAGATSDWNTWNWCTDQTAACYDKIQYLMYTSSYSKKYAGFYNWYTATAGSRLYSNGSGNATGDICPYGWHLPTGNNSGEFGKLSNALGGYQSNGTPQFMDYSTSPTGATMNAILKANSFYNNTYHHGSSQYINMSAYWSSTAYNNSRSRALFINTDRVAPGIYYANDKFYGFTIRCLKSN